MVTKRRPCVGAEASTFGHESFDATVVGFDHIEGSA